MLSNVDELIAVLALVYGDGPLPRDYGLLRAARGVQQGQDVKTLATRMRTTVRRLDHLTRSPDLLADLFKTSLVSATDGVALSKRRQGLGQPTPACRTRRARV
jgi:hypothetical protein